MYINCGIIYIYDIGMWYCIKELNQANKYIISMLTIIFIMKVFEIYPQ